MQDVYDLIDDCQWGEFYQAIEASWSAIELQRIDQIIPMDTLETRRESFRTDINGLLEEEGAVWRLDKSGVVIPAFPLEVSSALVEAEAAASGLARPGAAVHLEKARLYLSPTGDKENAVKEAVSALEAAVKAKSGDNDFDAGLKILKQQKLLNGAWPSAVQALYQYASREDQIRHGSPDVSDLSYEEARSLVGLSAILVQHIANLPEPRR